MIARNAIGLPPAQKQWRHREVEPGRLGAFDTHHLDVALGKVLQKFRNALLARLKNREVENDRPPEEKPRRTGKPCV